MNYGQENDQRHNGTNFGPPLTQHQSYLPPPPSGSLPNNSNVMSHMAPPPNYQSNTFQNPSAIGHHNSVPPTGSMYPPQVQNTGAPSPMQGPPGNVPFVPPIQTNNYPPMQNNNMPPPPQFGNQSQMLPPPSLGPPPSIIPPNQTFPNNAAPQYSNTIQMNDRTYQPVGINTRPPLSLNVHAAAGDYSPSNVISFGPGSTTSPHTSSANFGAYPPTGASNGPPLQYNNLRPPALSLAPPPSSYPDNTDYYKPDRIQAADYGVVPVGQGRESQSPASTMKRSMARIDPNQLPRPDKAAFNEVFHTRSGSGRRNPPLCNTLYCALDTGNAIPRHMRVTTVAPPATAVLQKQCSLPFAVLATPFADPENGEYDLPLIDMTDLVGIGSNFGSSFGSSPEPRTPQASGGAAAGGAVKQTPPRCTRCSGYVNPNVNFVEQGNKWQCNLCGMLNAVPTWYYCGLDASNQRIDRKMRPELQLGSVEFNVGRDYCVRPLQEPIHIFAIDISDRALGSGATMASLKAVHVSILRLREIEAAHQQHLATSFSNMNSQNNSFKGTTHNTTNSNVQFGAYNTQQQHHLALQTPHHEALRQVNIPQNVDANEYSIRVCIVTFNSQIQFYSVNERIKSPDPIKVSVVDSSDPFACVVPSEWLYSVSKQYELLEQLINRLPTLIVSLQGVTDLSGYNSRAFSNSIEEENLCCPTAVIKTIQCCLSTHGGRVHLLTTSHSTIGYGKIPKFRENLSHYQNNSELSLYGATSVLANANTITLNNTLSTAAAALVGVSGSKPTVQQSQAEELKALGELYTQLAADCVKSVLSVNVYAMIGDSLSSAPNFDSALLSEPSIATGGRLILVPGNMVSPEHIERLCEQLIGDLDIVRGSESVTKLRTSMGIRVDGYIGQGSYSEVNNELEFCSLDTNTSLMYTLKHDGALKDEDKIHLQLATLYTNAYKQRVVRVHNMTLQCSDKHAIIYRNSDIETVVVALMKQALHYALYNPLTADLSNKGPRAFLQDKIIDVLYCYRMHCSSASPRGQLILPESLKVLPIYTLSMLKHGSLIENHIKANLINTGNLTPLTPNMSSNNINNNTSRTNLLTMTTPRGLTRTTSSTGSNMNLLSLTANNSQNAQNYIKLIPVRGFERAYEIRKMLNISITDVINSIFPRMFNLFDILSAVQDDSQLLVSNMNNVDLNGQQEDQDDFYTGPITPRPDAMTAGFNQQHQAPTSRGNNRPTPTHTPQNNAAGRGNLARQGSLRRVYSSENNNTNEQCLVRPDLLQLIAPLHPNSEQFEAEGIYVLDDKTSIWFHVGRNVTQEQISSLFLLDASSPYDRPESLPFNTQTEWGVRTAQFVELLRELSVYKQDVRILWSDAARADSPTLAAKFTARLVEDSLPGVPEFSYTDYLCGMHAKIQEKLK